jgi:hypothetical protein
VGLASQAVHTVPKETGQLCEQTLQRCSFIQGTCSSACMRSGMLRTSLFLAYAAVHKGGSGVAAALLRAGWRRDRWRQSQPGAVTGPLWTAADQGYLSDLRQPEIAPFAVWVLRQNRFVQRIQCLAVFFHASSLQGDRSAATSDLMGISSIIALE